MSPVRVTASWRTVDSLLPRSEAWYATGTMMSERVTKFAEILTASMTNAEPSAYDMACARKLKKKLERLELLDMYHPNLQPLILEYFARELAAIRASSPAAARQQARRRRQSARQ